MWRNRAGGWRSGDGAWRSPRRVCCFLFVYFFKTDTFVFWRQQGPGHTNPSGFRVWLISFNFNFSIAVTSTGSPNLSEMSERCRFSPSLVFPLPLPLPLPQPPCLSSTLFLNAPLALRWTCTQPPCQNCQSLPQLPVTSSFFHFQCRTFGLSPSWRSLACEMRSPRMV